MNATLPEVPIWVKHGKKVWMEIRDKSGFEVLEYTAGAVTFADTNSRIIRMKLSDSGEEIQVRGNQILERHESEEVVSDLNDIPILNDAEILKFLRIRYNRNLIHCFCGPTLIVINPYKKIPHEESEELQSKITKALIEKRVKDLPPHVWTVSAFAFDYMLGLQQNQAICISGESGAGKTESTKRCLEFITQMKGESRSLTFVPVEQKIMSCNPLLEAFGNAKTFRNDNSSRFGKYTVLFIHRQKKNVRGASIQNYLLEKSRITNLAKEERNYHIFYAMCRFMPEKKKAKYFLLNRNNQCNLEDFYYLSQSSIFEVPKVNDKEFYEDVIQAFKDLDFKKEQRDAIWRILASILLIGNFTVDGSQFDDGKKPCAIEKDDNWTKVGRLLEGDLAAFEEALTHKVIKVGSSVTKSPLPPQKVKVYIDTLTRELYNRTFNWIVQKLNVTLLPKNTQDPAFLTIGVLDIFGFEIFAKNSLEQLFINYANERLQALYVDYIFKNECRIFEEEGLGKFTSLIVYKDNRSLVLSLDHPKLPPGVFDCLDQACSLNKTDDVFYSEIQKQHKASEHIVFPKIQKSLTFMVRHTARDVEYVADGFTDKNKEEFPEFLNKFIQTCKPAIVGIFNRTLDLPEGQDPTAMAEGGSKNRQVSLGFKFRRDMDDLINSLSKCYCHFVRCLKPNELKKADLWNPTLALMQIRYMGLLDSLKIRKNSFPFRYTYAKFFEIFQDIDISGEAQKSITQLERERANFEQLSRNLLNHCGIQFSEKDLLFGRTKIFLNERLKIELERALLIKQKLKKDALKVIQDLYKNFTKRRDIGFFMVSQDRSIRISRDLLRSWTAKIDGLKLKTFLKMVVRLQKTFRANKVHRMQRLKRYNMEFITHYLAMYKLTTLIQFILYHKRKISVLQAVFDRRIKESQERFCRTQVLKCIDISWSKIKQRKENGSSFVIQRIFRAYVLRAQRRNDFLLLNKKVELSRDNRAAVAIQRDVRGFLVKARLRRLNESAKKIQGYWRMKSIKNYFLNVKASVLIIQRFFKKHFVRQKQIRERTNEFIAKFGTLNQTVSRLEYNILFSDLDKFTDLKNVNDYTKLPFFHYKAHPDFGYKNYRFFVPKVLDHDSSKKVKLFAVPVDINVHIDTTNIYNSTWAYEFATLMKKLSQKNKRLMQVEVGETFTYAINEDAEVFSWGLNDFNQCGRVSGKNVNQGGNDGQLSGFCLPVEKNKNLSLLNLRSISAGKDHSLLIDEGNNLYVWGRNLEGQLGLGHRKPVSHVVSLNTIKDSIKAAITKEGKNYALTFDGKVIYWPSTKNDVNGQKLNIASDRMNAPNNDIGYKLPFPFSFINFPPKVLVASLDVGTDFAFFIASNGVVFSYGLNEYGQLGHGDNEPRTQPAVVLFFKNANEKVIEVSCGNKHVIGRTNVGRVYAWGLNSEGQLGTGNRDPYYFPNKIKFNDNKVAKAYPRSVQAGFNSSFVLFETKHIYHMGKIGGNQQKETLTPTPFLYEGRVFTDSNFDDFRPVKIITKWSKILTLTLVLLADFRYEGSVKEGSTMKDRVADKIMSVWTDYNQQSDLNSIPSL